MKILAAVAHPPAGALHRVRRAALWGAVAVAGLATQTGWAQAAVAPAAGGVALPAIVVWDFDNQTPPGTPARHRTDFLQRALSENLTAALLQTPGVQVVERQRLKDLLAEQQVAASDLADEDARLRLGKIVGAARMVFGGFFTLGDTVQVHLRVIDTATSRVLYSDETAVPVQQVMQTVAPLNQRLARALGGNAVAGVTGAGRSYPAALWQAYDRALALADAGDLDRAAQALQGLLAQDKDFTPAERQLVALLEKMARR